MSVRPRKHATTRGGPMQAVPEFTSARQARRGTTASGRSRQAKASGVTLRSPRCKPSPSPPSPPPMPTSTVLVALTSHC
eukprot:5878517-Prymnesium_polylepis.1